MKVEKLSVEFGRAFGLEIIVLGIISMEIIFKVMVMIEIIRDVNVGRIEETSEDSTLGHLNLRVRKIRRSQFKGLKMNF